MEPASGTANSVTAKLSVLTRSTKLDVSLKNRNAVITYTPIHKSQIIRYIGRDNILFFSILQASLCIKTSLLITVKNKVSTFTDRSKFLMVIASGIIHIKDISEGVGIAVVGRRVGEKHANAVTVVYVAPPTVEVQRGWNEEPVAASQAGEGQNQEHECCSSHCSDFFARAK